MSVEIVLKDVSGIYSRLLDHRPILNGEIRFMLKEFEEKRSEREGKRLQKAMVDSSELAVDTLPQTLVGLEAHLGLLNQKVNDCTKLCEEIAKKEEKIQSDQLSQQRAAREEEWRHFIQEQCEKSSAVDEWFKNEVESAESHYTELEKKLNLPPSL